MDRQARSRLELSMFTAMGNIIFSRFVKLVPSLKDGQYCVLAGPGDTPCGISNQRPLNTPSDYIATLGDQFFVYTPWFPAQQPWLMVDAAYPQGTLLKPGALGIGTIANGNGDIFGAIMMQESMKANDIVQVQVVPAQWFSVAPPSISAADYSGTGYSGTSYSGAGYFD